MLWIPVISSRCSSPPVLAVILQLWYVGLAEVHILISNYLLPSCCSLLPATLCLFVGLTFKCSSQAPPSKPVPKAVITKHRRSRSLVDMDITKAIQVCMPKISSLLYQQCVSIHLSIYIYVCLMISGPIHLIRPFLLVYHACQHGSPMLSRALFLSFVLFPLLAFSCAKDKFCLCFIFKSNVGHHH